MVVIVLLVVFVLFMLSRGSAASRSAKKLLALETNGLRARGLVLACTQLTTGRTINGRRFEVRTMTLDIEIPGRAPYVRRGDFLVPRGLVETVPGASLDLAVHASDQSQVAILGPGGFSGPWLRVGPPAPY